MRLGFLFCLSFLFSCLLRGQVPVSREPRHHVVFENKRVRILNVLVPPGDTTQYHIHSTPSLFICFTSTRTADQRIDQQPRAGISVAGNIWFENLGAPHLKVHRVMNQDTGTFHVMDVELLSGDSGFIHPPLHLPGVKMVIDTSWSRAYRLELKAGIRFAINRNPSGFILISVHESKITRWKSGMKKTLHLSEGDFLWISPFEDLTITNEAGKPENFALFEIK